MTERVLLIGIAPGAVDAAGRDAPGIRPSIAAPARPARRAAWRLALVLSVVLASGPAFAVDDSDRSAGRDAIAGQIEALRRDDGPAAFAFASPGIQGLFGTAEAFLDMVRRQYAPVHRPRDFAFGDTRDVADGFEQAVAIRDAAGAEWDAVYTFERGPDGIWRISGCRLVKRPGEAV